VNIPSTKTVTFSRTAQLWWKDSRRRRGFAATVLDFFSKLLGFARDSMPDRKRQRYGDINFDWDHRVDTTGATVSWKNRLLGVFLSPYQPTDPALFQEMLQTLPNDISAFTFIDIGSGKGRTLLMAADYPFRRVIGVELLPSLHEVSVANIARYASGDQKCFSLEPVCEDACDFSFPPEPTILYLFNPLPESGLESLMQNLHGSLRKQPRPVYVLYHNPLLEHVIRRSADLKKVAGTHQYSVYANL
jgi:SAM-dependent methyltransferase